uniref:Ig-like domain-containing protein n=1 Tax=Anas zonorhyncha TaxID=75864 RepID=A0A8B9UK93_9AVES
MGGGFFALALPHGVWASAGTASASALEAWEQRALWGAQGAAGVPPPPWGSVVSWLPPLGSFPALPHLLSPGPTTGAPWPLPIPCMWGSRGSGSRRRCHRGWEGSGDGEGVGGWGGGTRVGPGLQNVSEPCPAQAGGWGPGEVEWDPLTCPAHTGFFQFLGTCECHYLNGTERVRYLDTYIYNRQQYAHFDSDVGHYVADTELGKPDADYWNSQPEILEYQRGSVDRFCRHNYEVSDTYILHRRVEPKVRVSPMQSSSLPQTDRLACYVTGFYPAEIQVKWFKNGQEETKHVVSTDVIQNGDWTYQVLVMLESTPQHGDTYECHVQHASLKSPITYEWVLPADAARGKMLTGVGGLVLGLIFLALGLFLYVRRKGASLPRLQGS